MLSKLATITALAFAVGLTGTAMAQQSDDERLRAFYADDAMTILRSPDEVRVSFGSLDDESRTRLVNDCVEKKLGPTRDSQSIEDLCRELLEHDAMAGFYTDATMTSMIPADQVRATYDAMEPDAQSRVVEACEQRKLGPSRESQSIEDLCQSIAG